MNLITEKEWTELNDIQRQEFYNSFNQYVIRQQQKQYAYSIVVHLGALFGFGIFLTRILNYNFTGLEILLLAIFVDYLISRLRK